MAEQIIQRELDAINRRQFGEFITIVNQDIDDKGDYIFFLSFLVNEENTKKTVVLYSQNKYRREFKSLHTLTDYLIRYCSNTRSIEIKLTGKTMKKFPYLTEVNFNL